MLVKYRFLALLTFFLVMTQVVEVHAFGLANLVVKVVDETGTPVEKAHLNVRFSSNSGPMKGFTDEHGVFEAKAMSNDGVILGDITKDGYYESGIAHSFYVTKFGMWQPFGKELTVVMRPIINPVPMYVRNNFFKSPALDKEVGFDLEKADWVIPYGQGTNADFIFKIERRFDNVDNFDAKLTLTFSNPYDGIQVFKDDGGGDFNVGSIFRWPRMAPENGYHPVEKKHTSTGIYGNHDDNFDDNNYIFRVRSEVDKDGKLKRAMYGKIRGDIKFSPGTSEIGMCYYLNPDFTRNLEFDPSRNLFISLPSRERIGLP